MEFIYSTIKDNDQSVFIPHRHLSDNVQKTINIIHFCKQNQINSAILALDIERAFDHFKLHFLLTLLNHMGFGSNFLHAISCHSTNQNFKSMSMDFNLIISL